MKKLLISLFLLSLLVCGFVFAEYFGGTILINPTTGAVTITNSLGVVGHATITDFLNVGHNIQINDLWAFDGQTTNLTLNPSNNFGMIILGTNTDVRGTLTVNGVAVGGGQPAHPGLTNITEVATNGILVRTATNTFVARTIAAGSSKITISNGDGVSGAPIIDADFSTLQPGSSTLTNLALGNGSGLTNVQPGHAGLTNISVLATNGLVARTASNTFLARTITAASSKITVSNGDGVDGSPAIDADFSTLQPGNAVLTNLAEVTPWAKGTMLVATNTAGKLSPLAVGSDTQILTADSSVSNGVKWAAPATAGTVTAVGLNTLPAQWGTNSGQVTSSGSLGWTNVFQSANRVWAGPTTGGADNPDFRALVTGDFPNAPITNFTRTIITAEGITVYSVPTGCKHIFVEMIGGGGGGGAVDGAASASAAGAGGGSGAYCSTNIVSPAASYICTVGTNGLGGATPSGSGTAGSSTLFTNLMTCPGGSGGAGQASSSADKISLGGAGATTATGGTVNSGGNMGGHGLTVVGTLAVSGAGAGSHFGGGGAGQTAAVGGAATGYGAGGGGAAVITNTDRAGGDGTPGIIIIWEFYK